MKVSGTMIHLSRNISQSIGDRSDQGIREISEVTCTKLYVRHDNVIGSPADYSDDTWVRYQHDTGTDSPLMFCDNSPDPSVSISCNTTCTGNYYELMRVRDLAYTIVIDDVNLQYYTGIILSAYANNALAYDPITNPKIENMQTKISYISHSW